MTNFKSNIAWTINGVSIILLHTTLIKVYIDVVFTAKVLCFITELNQVFRNLAPNNAIGPGTVRQNKTDVFVEKLSGCYGDDQMG
jgi:hypothetical protein